MSNKTISINPSLFSIGGSKTKKNKEKKAKPTAVPLISPSVLKNKLLKRIKEHKQKETISLDNNKRKLSIKPEVTEVKNDFSDEFNDSINYLQTLSKQKRIDDEKRISEINKQKYREELERKTIRNYHSMEQTPAINIDLPEELIQPLTTSVISEPFKINTRNNDVPYGVLKGGVKPSYREWSRTQRNNIVTNPNDSLIIENNHFSAEKTARENRLNILKQKIKNKAEESLIDPLMKDNLIKKPFETSIVASTIIPSTPPMPIPIITPSTSNNIIQEQHGGKLVATKHITKKTIKRKYTLGRSAIKKTVSVLIKDKGTRKQILHAQKELKRKNINDIKAYLREHNLIKTGSIAPNDVLRKLYESAMLSGEITNSNPDILLHNFSKQDKEL